MGLIQIIQKHNENVHHRRANELKEREIQIIRQQEKDIARISEQQESNKQNKINDLTPNFCTGCGAKLSFDSIYCSKCGKKV